MNTKEKKGTVLHHKHDEEKKLNETAEGFAKRLSKALESFAALGLKEQITINDLPEIRDPEIFVRQLIFEGNEVLKALPIEKSHALAMIKVPANLPQFITDVKAVHVTWNSQNNNPIALNLSQYEVNGTEVKVKDSLYELSKDIACVRCKNDAQEEIYATCKEINDKINALMEKYPGVKIVDKDLNSDAILVQSTKQHPQHSHIYEPHLYFRPLKISKIE